MQEVFLGKLEKTTKGLHKQDMESKGAKEIKRYAEFSYPEGYNYFIIKN